MGKNLLSSWLCPIFFLQTDIMRLRLSFFWGCSKCVCFLNSIKEAVTMTWHLYFLRLLWINEAMKLWSCYKEIKGLLDCDKVVSLSSVRLYWEFLEKSKESVMLRPRKIPIDVKWGLKPKKLSDWRGHTLELPDWIHKGRDP